MKINLAIGAGILLDLATIALEQGLALNPRDTGTLQAKGLYDIMARLERPSVAESEDPKATENE